MTNYPQWVAGGWDTRTIPDLFKFARFFLFASTFPDHDFAISASWYQNAPDGVTPPFNTTGFLPNANSPFTGQASYVAAANLAAATPSSSAAPSSASSSSTQPLTMTTILAPATTVAAPAGSRAPGSGSTGSGSGSQNQKGKTSSAGRMVASGFLTACIGAVAIALAA